MDREETNSDERAGESDLSPEEIMEESNERAGESDLSPEEIMEEAKEEALDFLEGLLDAMELEGEVHLEATDESLEASIEGEDSGILIGRRGQTLEAIQDLLRTAVQRHVKERVRVNLDVEGYRARRKESVAELAVESAEAALSGGAEVELEPMNPFERKVVHEAVAEIQGVTSYSEGEEPNRRVIIRPENVESNT